ncbi:MAG: bifunctional 5,10-methylenetetrahydrofolate dehydrogenase/5,10-methenyltetrahydrofolate cyclohydrolase [Eubacterium sp.]|nr:bifunctional 5,10-methylenetetrahydrofolate dehydrogenase/5,10-methenyltetrahydrofolate cyclohydrolase [Eubacterium sp.]
MAEILKGKPVADKITQQTEYIIKKLKEKGITPKLAILRVGERKDDIAYENAVSKRCEKVGIEVSRITLPSDVKEKVFFDALYDISYDVKVHGILMFQPLPKHIDSEAARKMLPPEKDVDGATSGSLAGVFTGEDLGFPPCTAKAAMEILDYYNIEISGKKAAVIGRSLVVGRPVACMLMEENATVTVCHTKTKDVREITKAADIIIAASGQMESIDETYLSKDKDQTIIDVGIAWNEAKNKLCGDVLFENVSEKVYALTPVPGGVGAVTNSILALHVAEAAGRMK